jgi:hypothetical protein
MAVLALVLKTTRVLVVILVDSRTHQRSRAVAIASLGVSKANQDSHCVMSALLPNIKLLPGE